MLIHTAGVCGLALIVRIILLSCSPFRKTLGIFLEDREILWNNLMKAPFQKLHFVTDVIFVINQASKEIAGFY